MLLKNGIFKLVQSFVSEINQSPHSTFTLKYTQLLILSLFSNIIKKNEKVNDKYKKIHLAKTIINVQTFYK